MPPRKKKTMQFHVAVDSGGDLTYHEFEFKQPDDYVSKFLREFLTELGGNISVIDVKLYDASLSEWAADPALPMETG